MANKRLRNIFIFTTIGIIAFCIVIILFISPLTKYVIEKYDEKYTGRQIKIGWVYVNPFTGYINFHKIKMYEYQTDSVFFATEELSIDFSLHKLISKTYEIENISIEHPWISVVQSKSKFNFDDLIARFNPKESEEKKEPLHFNLLNVKITEGKIRYQETLIPVNYSLQQIYFESPGKQWNVDTVAGKISFRPGIGNGYVKSNFSVNLNNLDYRLAVVVTKLDIALFAQYLKELTNYGSMRAKVNANIQATGNLNDKEDIMAHGQISIEDFHFGKNRDEDYVSCDKLAIKIDTLSPRNHKYLIDSICLVHPFFEYEMYDSLNNVEAIFGESAANIKAVAADPERFNPVIEIARYVKILAKNFFKSNYKVGKVAIYKGNIKFNDYSLNEKFSIALNPLNVLADSINKNRERVKLTLQSGIRPYGNLLMTLSINPKDSSDFELTYSFEKIPTAMFNPYIISYTSFPLNRGTMELYGKWNVKNGMINSKNHLLVIDPRRTKRIKNKNVQWIPMSLIMAFVRERSNAIDYEIPITGNLNNPQFHLHDVIFDLLKNIFIKPPTTPYRMQVKNVETEIEKSLTLEWRTREATLSNNQEKFLKKAADHLDKNPDASITIQPIRYLLKENEYILFFEAKKKYYQFKNHIKEPLLSQRDSAVINKMSIKDPLFVKYLNTKIEDSLLFTIQDKCKKFISADEIRNTLTQLQKAREEKFMSYFKEKSVEGRVKMLKVKDEVPYNGFSFYKIDYKGELPKALQKAYVKMNELNNTPPRKKFKQIRREKIK